MDKGLEKLCHDCTDARSPLLSIEVGATNQKNSTRKRNPCNYSLYISISEHILVNSERSLLWFSRMVWHSISFGSKSWNKQPSSYYSHYHTWQLKLLLVLDIYIIYLNRISFKRASFHFLFLSHYLLPFHRLIKLQQKASLLCYLK